MFSDSESDDDSQGFPEDSMVFRDEEFNLPQQLNEFRRTGKFIDLDILTKDGKIVQAHRLVIASQFPMLNSYIIDSDDVPLDFRQFDSDIVEAVVNYAYTFSIDLAEDTVLRIFLLATKIGSKDIRGFCTDFLSNHVSMANLICVWAVANVTHCQGLINICLPTVFENFDAIVEDCVFGACTEPQFLAPILCAEEVKDVEKKVKALERWYYGRLSVDEPNAAKLVLLRLITALNGKKVPQEVVSSIVSKGREYPISEEFLNNFVRSVEENQSQSS
ncbi:hypothetical protein Aperf_G00000115843 [Anoplocephala perfoliata]